MRLVVGRRCASALLLAALLLAGCASPATYQSMTVSAPVAASRQHPYTVSVTTSGGAETTALGSSAIGNQELKLAIENSIEDSKLFQEIAKGRPGQYQLNVSVTQIDKPVFGANFTVTLETAWSLVQTSDKRVVWRKSITGSHTATMSDAFAGVKRLQLAVEGAARDNIAKGIAGLADVTLESRQAAKATQ